MICNPCAEDTHELCLGDEWPCACEQATCRNEADAGLGPAVVGVRRDGPSLTGPVALLLAGAQTVLLALGIVAVGTTVGGVAWWVLIGVSAGCCAGCGVVAMRLGRDQLAARLELRRVRRGWEAL